MIFVVMGGVDFERVEGSIKAGGGIVWRCLETDGGICKEVFL